MGGCLFHASQLIQRLPGILIIKSPKRCVIHSLYLLGPLPRGIFGAPEALLGKGLFRLKILHQAGFLKKLHFQGIALLLIDGDPPGIGF